MDIVFDILILILLVSTALPAVILLRHLYDKQDSWEKRHKKITIGISVVLMIGFIIVSYGSFIEPRIIIVREEKIDLPKITKPIKIVLIADFQVGPYKKTEFVKRVSEKINSLQPDLVLIAGDQVNNSNNFDGDVQYLQGLEYLNKDFPTFMVHGNHEYGIGSDMSIYDKNYRLANISTQTKEMAEKIGIDYLINELKELEIKGQKINIFGGDSYWAQKLNLSVLKNRPNDNATIALIHNPIAIFDVDSYGVDLMLSGHTHGGQIRLPFIGPIVTVDGALPRKWQQGWISYRNTKMYITSGIGETGVRARLFTPPEIVVLTIY